MSTQYALLGILLMAIAVGRTPQHTQAADSCAVFGAVAGIWSPDTCQTYIVTSSVQVVAGTLSLFCPARPCCLMLKNR